MRNSTPHTPHPHQAVRIYHSALHAADVPRDVVRRVPLFRDIHDLLHRLCLCE